MPTKDRDPWLLEDNDAFDEPVDWRTVPEVKPHLRYESNVDESGFRPLLEDDDAARRLLLASSLWQQSRSRPSAQKVASRKPVTRGAMKTPKRIRVTGPLLGAA